MVAATVIRNAAKHAAWLEYLERCRSAQYADNPNHWQYEEVEAWAWRKLQERLRAAELTGR